LWSHEIRVLSQSCELITIQKTMVSVNTHSF
jgi:hypothetical protein